MTARADRIRDQRRDRFQRRNGWPFPEDRTALDRARRLAHVALLAAESPDPKTAAAEVRRHARMYGEHWLASVPETGDGARLLTAREAGIVVGRSHKTIYSWTTRGAVWPDGERHHLARHPGGYDERELLTFDAAMRGSHPTETSTAA